MRVLILGATGYIGSRLMSHLQADGRFDPIGGSRRGSLHLDTRDQYALTQALSASDAVVNCVAGSARAIAEGAQVLARAACAARVPAVVHLSSMAVFGDREASVHEDSPLGDVPGWYAQAKQTAEAAMTALAHKVTGPAGGVRVTVLRPGCVWGLGSTLWVDRIARWLVQGRLGDLGAAGDGWTHGVTVDDVCVAIVQALHRPAAPGALRVLHLAAPDSPRWNDWFTDLALGLGATPVRRISPWQLRADACVLGPPLELARRLLAPTPWAHTLPPPISPGLLRLWRSPLRMEATRAPKALGLTWTPYPTALRACLASIKADRAPAAGKDCETPASARAP